nr:MAG TPA: hypothetical protein [Caudoviricetes sp.]
MARNFINHKHIRHTPSQIWEGFFCCAYNGNF